MTDEYFPKDSFVNGARPSSYQPSVTRTPETAYRTALREVRPKLDIGPWARFPNKFFGSGMACKVGVSASVLYFALCENANRDQIPSNTFKISDKSLASDTDLSPRTMRDARIKLLENGLVSYSREPGQSYTYTLLRQELKWLKRSERLRQKRNPRAMAVSKA